MSDAWYRDRIELPPFVDGLGHHWTFEGECLDYMRLEPADLLYDLEVIFIDDLFETPTDEQRHLFQAWWEQFNRDNLCLVQDTSGDMPICNQRRGHYGVIHTETLADGTLWAQWRSILAEDETQRAQRYLAPRYRNGG